MSSEIRVLIVEDDPLIAIDIEQILSNLNFKVSDVSYNAEDALLQLKNNTPDAVLMDINLEDGKDGIDIATIINELYSLPFIFLTSHADRNTLERAKKTKPAGYIIKPFDEKDLLAGLEIALYNYAQNKFAQQPKLSIHSINKHLPNALSDREFDVLLAIYEGKTNQQMADTLFVSVNTIKTHIANIYSKLEVQSRTAAVAKVRNMQ
jgi:DNA-binding NarL/FixJ family response regulator